MNALQPPRPSGRRNSRRPIPKRRRQQKRPSHLSLTFEIFLKVGVNAVLSSAAVVALMELVPYHLSQKSKLNDIKQEVREARKQLKDLQKKFDVSFNDPKGALSELTPLVPANQLRVILDHDARE